MSRWEGDVGISAQEYSHEWGLGHLNWEEVAPVLLYEGKGVAVFDPEEGWP